MKTKLLGVTALGLLTAACGQGNLYPMTPDEAYAKLLTAKLKPSGKTGPFYMLPITVSGDGSSTVRWKQAETGLVLCEANVTAEGADKSRITAFCGAGGEGAAAGMTQAMNRKALIELIDATLRGRPYDQQKAMGSTAAGWPKDERQADASLGGAATEALKMQRDIQKMQKEADEFRDQERAEALQRAEEAKAHEGVTIKPGQPMIDVSK